MRPGLIVALATPGNAVILDLFLADPECWEISPSPRAPTSIEPVVRHLRTVAFRAIMRARAGGWRRGRRARFGLWRPGLQREVSGVQHDDFPNAFLPPFVRSATIP